MKQHDITSYSYCLQRIAEVIMTCKSSVQAVTAQKYCMMIIKKHSRDHHDYNKACEMYTYMNKVIF